jgi:hypothetical protein
MIACEERRKKESPGVSALVPYAACGLCAVPGAKPRGQCTEKGSSWRQGEPLRKLSPVHSAFVDTIKIKADANPYLPEYSGDFRRRPLVRVARRPCRSSHDGRLNEVHSRVALQGHSSGMLEPYDGKLSRTVLRGTGGLKGASVYPVKPMASSAGAFRPITPPGQRSPERRHL